MQRQNSIPLPLRSLKIPRSAEQNRRKSDVVVNKTNERPSVKFSGKNGLPTIPSVDDPESKIEPAMSKKRSKIISFGYASTAHHFRHRRRVSSKNLEQLEEGKKDEEKDIEEEGASTSSSIEDEDEESEMGVFFIRYPDMRVLPIYCYRPMGVQADQFLQSIADKHKEKLKKFLERERPQEGEYYVWIREDATMKTTVLSLKTLENHFKNEPVKRVKWRHLSIDRMSIYRYSVPVITTKFRLRLVHFLSQNYRCCILFIWCFVILFISIGIILSVVLGSPQYSNLTTNKNLTSTNFIMQG